MCRNVSASLINDVFNILQLWCYGEKFFFTHGKVLTVVIYKCETSSLAAAVGKLKDSQTSGKKFSDYSEI